MWRELLQTKAALDAAHHFAQSFDHSLVSEFKKGTGTIWDVANRVLCKAAYPLANL